MRKKYYSGSATIEAAFLLPIIIFTLIMFIYLIFYLYDMVKAEADADHLLFEMEKEIEFYNAETEVVGKDVSEVLRGYLQTDSVQARISCFGDTLMSEVEIKMNIPKIPLFSEGFFKDIYIVKTLQTGNRSEKNRMIGALIETVEGLKQRINGR